MSGNLPNKLKGEQTIFRALHDASHPFVRVTQSAAQDERLSFEARGAYVYLLSRPDDWKIQLRDLQRSGGIGRDRALRIQRELENHGYLIWSGKRRRLKQPNGTFRWSAPLLFESGNAPDSAFPTIAGNQGNSSDPPESGKPESGKPESGKPAAYKQTILQTNDHPNDRSTHPPTVERQPGSSACVSKSEFSREVRKQYAAENELRAGWLHVSADGRYDDAIKDRLEEKRANERRRPAHEENRPARPSALAANWQGSPLEPALRAIKETHNADTFESWFSELRYEGVSTDGAILASAPNPEVHEWIERKYLSLLKHPDGRIVQLVPRV